METFCVKKNLFGGNVDIVIKDAEPFIAEPIIDDAYNYALRLQKIFNFFDKNSKLSKLNKQREMEVSEHLANVVKHALRLCKLSRGQYDISIGKQTLSRKESKPIERLNCSYKDIKIVDKKIILTHKDVAIDLGSIAKGYIADRIADYLMSRGILSGLIDARGDLKIFGDRNEQIGIQHPRQKDSIICTIRLKNLSVATSGDYNQYDEDYDRSHIINKKDLISVTVVANNLEIADGYATMLSVLNKSDRETILDKNKNIKVLTVDKDINVNCYNGFEQLM